MMKKILSPLLVLASLVLTVVLLVSCGGGANVVEKVTLDAPTNIRFDAETSKVSWNGVKNADYYAVSFNSGEETQVKSTSVSYKNQDDEFTFSITAKSDGIYLASETKTVTFAKLDSDLNLTVDENGVLSWEEVEIATGYELYIDGKSTVKVPSNTYADLAPGSAHNVKVRPVKEDVSDTYYYSKWSNQITLTILGETAKESIKYDGQTIKWNAVNGASGYEVNVNGVKYEATSNQLQFDADGDNFNVTVKAIGDHTSKYDGKESAQKQFVYLDTVSNVTVENGALTWSEVEGASSYQIKLKANSNTPIVSQTNSYDRLVAGEQYNVSVIPVGQDTEVSYFSEWSSPVSIMVLSAPKIQWNAGLDVDGQDVANAVTWNLVPQAAGYTYQITLPNGETEEGQKGDQDVAVGHTFREAGNYEVRVKATANGAAGVFDSAYSDPIKVKRLTPPTINPSDVVSNRSSLSSGFNVTFNRVEGATKYILYRSGTEAKQSVTPGFSDASFYSEGQTRENEYAYYVQAIGSVSNDLKTVVLSSITGDQSDASAFTITILATPQSPTVVANEYSADFTYLGVASQNGYVVKVDEKPEDVQETNYSLAKLEPGQHAVKVCAAGDGHTVLPSDDSVAITVNRLIAPTNIRITTDESDGALSFTGADRAKSYQVFIDGLDHALTIDATTNVRDYISTQGTQLHMYAIANEFRDAQQTIFDMTSPASTVYSFIKLEAVTNINFSNTAMTWNAPSNLNQSGSVFTPTYLIADSNGDKYNGQFAGQSYPLTNYVAGKYSFQITAIGDGEHFINSDVSYSREITKLKTPTFEVDIANNQYKWRAVPDATGYTLKIDGNIVSTDIHVSGEVYTYIPTYTQIGTKVVELFAVGDEGQTTINSNSNNYDQVITQLQTPVFSYGYSTSTYTTESTILMKITTPSPYCSGYYYCIGETEHLDAGEEYSFNTNTSGEVALYVYAKGGTFDDTEKYYIDSRTAATTTVSILNYPSTISRTKDGVLEWSKVNDARGYIVDIEFETANGSYTKHVEINENKTGIDLSEPFEATVAGTTTTEQVEYTSITNMRVKIRAKGNYNTAGEYVTVSKIWITSSEKSQDFSNPWSAH